MLFSGSSRAIFVAGLDLDEGFVPQLGQVLAHGRSRLLFKVVLLDIVLDVLQLRNPAGDVLDHLKDHVSLLGEDGIGDIAGLQVEGLVFKDLDPTGRACTGPGRRLRPPWCRR